MSSLNLRTVREEPEFTDLLKSLKVSYKRIDEVMEALIFALARSPEEFEMLPGTHLSMAKTVNTSDLPALRVFFTCSDKEVRLLGGEVAGDDCAPF
ncbi:MAG: hypothetical protein ABSB15_02605 [Bryobacteraceae bacterium]